LQTKDEHKRGQWIFLSRYGGKRGPADHGPRYSAIGVLLLALGGVGGRVGLFRDPPQIKAVIEELHRAQAEANLQCQ